MMLDLPPSQTALVLSGGGAKGAYQIGAIAALNDLQIRCGHVFGSSVGALNAAMYAQGRIDRANALWQQLRLDDILHADSASLAEDAESIFGRPDKLLEFLSKHAHRKGADIRPLVSLLQAYVDESAVRTGAARMGLVTVRFPSLTRVDRFIEDIPPGKLHQWLLASASCFPVFPMASIDGARYIDGGFCENAPVDMAVRCGASRIIVVDIGRVPAHPHYRHYPHITYIRPGQPLGGLLSFDPSRSARNRALGYNDTLRAFGRVLGTLYTFLPSSDLLPLARDFLARLSRFELSVSKNGESLLFPVLQQLLTPGADSLSWFLHACELCGRSVALDPVQTYTFSSFCSALHAALPLDRADALLDSLLGERIGILFASGEYDQALIITCLYRLLVRRQVLPSAAVHTLRSHPPELLCAFTLRFLF